MGVTLFVSKPIDGHRQELHTALEILVDMGRSCAVDVEIPLTECLRSGFVASENAKPVSDHLEALLDSLRIVSALVELPTLRYDLGMQTR